MNNMLCENRLEGRTVRTVENRCSCTSTSVLTGTWEMDDAELLKDLRGLGKPPSFDGKDTMLVNRAVDTRETFILESSGQKYREEILPLGETSSRSPLERERTNTTEPSEKWTTR